MAKQLLLIDGNSIVFRAFFAMHNQMEKFTNQAGLTDAGSHIKGGSTRRRLGGL